MALDPSYATAYALAATCHGERFYEGTSADPVADHMEAERLSRLALTFDRFDPLALSLCGHIRSWLFRDYDQAIELFDRALAANPSAAIAWLRSSATFSYIGEPREARRRVDIGLSLSPYDAHVFFSYGLVGPRGLRQRRLCRGGELGAEVDGGQSALRRQPALPRGQPGGERPVPRSAPGRPGPAAAQSRASARAKFAAGHAFKDPEMRLRFARSSRAGGAAGVIPPSLLPARFVSTQP